MIGRARQDGMMIFTVALATLFWFATFYLEFSTFWTKIALAAAVLALLSFLAAPDITARFRFDGRALVTGVASAVLLYLIFWAGKEISSLLFPFAEDQIGGIYDKGAGSDPRMIFFLLLLVTGPCEEIYWRGFLQDRLMTRFGKNRGWLLATVVYAGVHLWSFNFMLVGAATVAGAFWGALYLRTGALAPVIISHSLWSAVIFTIAPLGS